MWHKTGITVLFLLAVSGVFGQEFSSRYYDSLTYSLYTRGNWKELAAAGREAVDAGNDYYYLRMRTGFAWFNMGNYRKAAAEFRKALEFNSGDTIAGYYFKQSSLWGDASCPSPSSAKGVTMALLEAGGSVSSPAGLSQEMIADTSVFLSQENLPGSKLYGSMGLGIRASSRLSFYLGYSGIRQNGEKNLSYKSVEARRDSIVPRDYGSDYFYSFPAAVSHESLHYDITQKGFYFSTSYVIAPGLSISPAVHLLSVARRDHYAVPYSESGQDTAWFNRYDTSWHTFEYTASGYKIYRYDTAFRNYALSLELYKDIGSLKAGVSFTYARLYDRKPLQAGVSLFWYPHGNTGLVVKGKATLQREGNVNQTVFELGSVFRVLPRVWLEPLAVLPAGKISNFLEQHGYVVRNEPEPLLYREGINLHWQVNNKLKLSLYGSRLSQSLEHFAFGRENQVITTEDFSSFNLVSTLIWNIR